MKTMIEVEIETDARGEFVALTVGDQQPIPLPQDKPAPRRLARDLADAVRASNAPKPPAEPSEPTKDAAPSPKVKS